MERYIPRPRELALERLKAYILEHHLQPGDCLPPERELCRSWGVNRTTLRSAIARLEASGLLYAVQGSGTRIRHRFRITLDHLSSFSEAAVACGFQPETKLLSFTTVSRDEYLERIFYWAKADLFYKFSCLRLLNQDPVMINTAYFPADLAPGLTEDDLVNGSLTTSVVNQSGATLPSTGGIGTTVFYVLGSVLVVGAAVLLITKRRMNR